MCNHAKKYWILLGGFFFTSVVVVFILAKLYSPMQGIGVQYRGTDVIESYQGESVIPQLQVQSYRIVNRYPHDREAFTQGLLFNGGFLYESTGLKGRSTLRKVELETGTVVKLYAVPDMYFAEGLTICSNRLIQLTWRAGKGFIYDIATLEKIGEFDYDGEGWGLACDGQYLIMSDGTATLRFIDPGTFEVVRKLTVLDRDNPIAYLNELEYVKGELFANVWMTDYIVRISPETGAVLGWIDFRGLKSEGDVLNGIAFDRERNRLFVTGKLWPEIFEVALAP